MIEDVVTTGGSTKEVIRLLQSLEPTVLAAGSIIDRSGGRADVGVPRVSLDTLERRMITTARLPALPGW